ncbi:hypothetical protein IPA_03385 [Ignicoccus pacificus DSM 13166]|uniref:Peptidase S8/S53 domain-containing protein n=1 Tax=Ignicoccus pacificus DSM 13166 TaxID=940294 RepID=A0A977PKT2_9CREN|nr:hypothetical protein IPA_03385 [Ignicoccus pacificus DSM 13166]
MDRALLSALLLVSIALAVEFPGFGWTINPLAQGFYQAGPIKLVRGGGYPIYLGTYQAVPGNQSGVCVPFWWRDLVGAKQANDAGINGKGVKVLIIDSGVDDKVLKQVFGRGVDYHFNAAYQVYKDQCIKNETIAGIKYCILEEIPSGWQKIVYAIPLNQSLDEMGHGTAVAATILSIAPNVTLYSARVAIDMLILDQNNTLYAKQVLIDSFAVNWALTHAVYGPDLKPGTSDDADIVNMSLGGMFYPSPGPMESLDIPYELLIWYLYRVPLQNLSKNVLVVAAAGNDAENIPAVPAGIDEATAVSALEYLNGSWVLAPFTQTGYGIDFAELGAGMYLPVPKNSIIAQYINDSCSNVTGDVKWVRLDGTSFAAPMLSGLAALWEQASGLKGQELYNLLKSNAIDLGPTGYDQETGWGMVKAPTGTIVLNNSSSTSSTGIPMIFAPALVALRKKKKVLAALLLLSASVFALNVTANSVAIASALASGVTAYLAYGDLTASVISALLGFGIMMSALFLAMLILKILKKQ